LKRKTGIIIGIIIVAIYLPIHYYYPFLGIGSTTEEFGWPIDEQPEFFKTTYVGLLDRFHEAQTQFDNDDITEDEYRYLIKERYEQLQSLYNDVRNYDWENEDVNDYNYWFEGKLKFLNDLEAEYDRLQPFAEPEPHPESEPEPPIDPVELEEFIVENFTMTLDQNRISVLLRGDHEYIPVRLFSTDEDGSMSPLPRFPTNYRVSVVEDSQEKIDNWLTFDDPTLPYGVDGYLYGSEGKLYIAIRNFQAVEIDAGEYFLRAIWMNRDSGDYDSIPFTVEFLEYPR